MLFKAENELTKRAEAVKIDPPKAVESFFFLVVSLASITRPAFAIVVKNRTFKIKSS